MPIMAKSNDEYAEVKAIKTPDGTEIDYVLSKVDNTYKRTYTATRELEGAPPLEFKSIKPNANLTDYRIYGQTSRNLFDENSLISPISSFTWYFDDEHYLLATNSSSDNRAWRYSQSQFFIALSAGTYTLQLSGVGANSQYSDIYVFKSNNNVIYSENITGKTNIVITFTLNTAETIGIEIKLYDGKYRFMLVEGSTPLPYEPYGESVGDKTGNLFDMKKFAETCYQTFATVNYTNNTLTFTATAADAYVNTVFPKEAMVYIQYRSACIDVLPATTYTISMSSMPKCYISWIDSSYKAVSTYTQIPANQTSYTFTTPEDCTKLLFRLGKEVTGAGDTFTISNIMLNEGSTPFPYEPYGYKVPVTVSNGTDTLTTPIYLPEQIKKVGDEAEYIDYGEQKFHRISGADLDVTLPALPTLAGTNVLSVGTEVQPSDMYIKGNFKMIAGGGE